ncbi:MAG: hypothetical protein ACKOXB_00965, partial [Flavobacteriales bacterium]
MNMKFGLVLMMMAMSFGAFSQTDCSTSAPSYCDFPGDGASVTDEIHSTGTNEWEGIISFVHITGGDGGVNTAFRIHTLTGESHFNYIFDDVLTESVPSLIQSHYICLPFSSSAYTITGRAIENRSSERDIELSEFKISVDGNQICYVTTDSKGTSGNNSSTQSSCSLYLLPGKMYKVEGYVNYNDHCTTLFGCTGNHYCPPFIMYICVGGIGGVGDYVPSISASGTCPYNKIHVNNYDNKVKYYWSTSSASFTYDASHELNSSGEATVTAGTYYVRAYHAASGYVSATSNAITISPATPPSAPSYSGAQYLCECNPASNISIGAGGNQVKWYSGLTVSGVDQWTEINSDQILSQFSQGKNIGVASYNTSNGCPSTVLKLNISVLPCDACGSSFAPLPGNKYVLSAWVSDSRIGAMNVADFEKSNIVLHF